MSHDALDTWAVQRTVERAWRLGSRYEVLKTVLYEPMRPHLKGNSGNEKEGIYVQALSSKTFLWPPLLLDFFPRHHYMTEYRCLNKLFT